MGLTSAFSKKGGGGRLNNVDGLIVDYQFSPDFPYKAKNGGGKKASGSNFNTLWFNLSVQADGETEPTVEPLFAGSADDWDISEDGHVLTPKEDAEKTPRLFGNAPRFLQSCIDHGFEEPDYDEGGDVDLSTIINNRARFVQVKDEEAMANAAKRFAKSQGKHNAQGQKKGKDGKYYDMRTLEVSEFYGEADVEETPAKGKKTGKAAPVAAGKKKKDAEEEAPDHTETAKEVLLAVLETVDPINRSKLGIQALKAMLKLKTPKTDHNDILEVLKSDDFLETEDGWTYDAKKGVVASE